MESILRAAIETVVPIIEAIGALVVVMGCARAIVRYLAGFFGKRQPRVTHLRLELGESLVLGLEFQVASDIIMTALSPTWEEMGLLAATIGLRALLDFFLRNELAALDGSPRTSGTRRAPGRAAPQPPPAPDATQTT